MSLFKLGKNFVDTFEVLSRPKREFTSSSAGVTGDIRVFPDTSTLIKEVADSSTDLTFDDNGLEELRETIIGMRSISPESMQLYLDTVNGVTSNSRFDKRVEILRFEPSVSFTSDTVRKGVIKNNLYPYRS